MLQNTPPSGDVASRYNRVHRKSAASRKNVIGVVRFETEYDLQQRKVVMHLRTTQKSPFLISKKRATDTEFQKSTKASTEYRAGLRD
jgi:hypothetical protein